MKTAPKTDYKYGTPPPTGTKARGRFYVNARRKNIRTTDKQIIREHRKSVANENGMLEEWKFLVDEADVQNDPVGVIEFWCESQLTIPEGPKRGQPFKIENWQVDFLKSAMQTSARESALCISRKNGKSALIAALVLAYLVGPLNVPNWRASVSSLTGELAKELRRSIQAIAEASGLEGFHVYTSPTPGRITGQRGAALDILACDKSTGHARGNDLAIIDEAGLLKEKHRDLWAATFTSISGRNGKFLCISVRGECPMFEEMRDRADGKKVIWQEYAAPIDCELDDEKAWHSANPGLKSGIKSIEYMRDAAEKAIKTPADEANFRSLDLNAPRDPGREMIVSLSQWKLVEKEKLPEREGPCFVGLDLGGSVSMSACAAFWPNTGRLEVMGCFGDTPNLSKRGKNDSVGELYVQMEKRGELITFPGEVTPIGDFLEYFVETLEGSQIIGFVADRFKRAELRMEFQKQGLNLPTEWRSRNWSESSEDVRHFQKRVIQQSISIRKSLLMHSAITDSALEVDTSGSCKLDKARSKGRIDALSSAVLAVAAGERTKVVMESQSDFDIEIA